MPLNYYSKTFLSLPQFIQKTEPTYRIYRNRRITTLHGQMESDCPRVCPSCGGFLHIHQYHTVKLKHIAIGPELMELVVTYKRFTCSVCHQMVSQDIPFKQPHHFMTKMYYQQIMGLLGSGSMSLQQVSKILHTNKHLVRTIDKQRLQAIAGDRKPTHTSRFIGVDEFSLHNHHRYATIVIDLETGESLFVEEGNSEAQLHHFFDFVGRAFMRGVKAISMDMNAQYDAAIRNRYPHIKVVFDPFHIVKNYNDRVISELRKREQRRLRDDIEKSKKSGDTEKEKALVKEYKLYKHSRFVLVSNLKTLQAKDAAAKEHNQHLVDQFECKGLSIPVGERKWSTTNERRLQDVLSINSDLQTTYTLLAMLKLSFTCRDTQVFTKDLEHWLAVARKTGLQELIGFCKMLEKRIQGIVNHVIYPISNGPLEGTNNLIKTIRRQAYGYRDQEYFFLKIWEATRRYPKKRSFTSHRNSA